MTGPAEATPPWTRDDYTRDDYTRGDYTRGEYWRDLAQRAWDRGRAAADAADLPEARRWLERARRLQPRDDTIAFSLATVLLRSGAAEEAAPLFAGVAERHGIADAWAGLAACRQLLGRAGQAAEALQAALSRSVPTAAVLGLAGPVAAEAGLPGWCGVDGQGVLHPGSARPDSVLLDGTPVRPGPEGALPAAWRRARFLSATLGGAPLLGSPVDLAALRAVEGFIELREGELHGWAWRPADPALDPVVVVNGQPIRLQELSPIRLSRPLARPRLLHLPMSQLGPVVELRGSDGRHLLGSPIHLRPPPPRARSIRATTRRPEPADVVVPVHGGLTHTLACLASVLATVPPGTRVHVVDDASPDPALAAALDALARDERIELIRLAENRGFPAAANAGLRACGRRDAVLLNSDTLVPPGWLKRLRAAAYAAPDIGTATPLSNDATILSYPDPAGGNKVPDAAGVEVLDTLAQRANGAAVADVPTAVGFCMYLRRDCLDRVGPLREDVFAQGYGEENDWCRRAAGLGFRHVAALDVFVGHVGGQSFGAARTHLLARNLRVLNRLHSGYDALVAEHIRADPLAPARRRMDALHWAEGAAARSAVLITHAGGGGVDRVVAARCTALRAEGLRPVVLRPRDQRCLVGDGAGTFPNLAYALPDELDALLDLLRAGRPRHVELHHALGHQPAVLQVPARLGLPLDTYVHDYALFCPRISLVGCNGRYCGEPDIAGCVACVGEAGSHLEEPIGVPELVVRSAGLLESSRRVVAPSADAAARVRRHFPRVRPEVLPWEDDSDLPPLAPAPGGPVRRVCVPGAIGVEKGYDVLLALVRDARARRLPISFVVVGYTNDDTALMDAGPVFVTGEYAEAEAIALIRAQRAHLALIPSVWPETWCYALSRAWQAGLPAAAFDLGAPAERIRRTGRGWVLPLGLPPSALNDALLRLPLSFPSHRTESRASFAVNQPVVL